MKNKITFEKFSDLLNKVGTIKAFIFTNSEMTKEDYEKISFSQWQEIEKGTGSEYHPELQKLALQWMIKKFDQESSDFKECQKLFLLLNCEYLVEEKKLKRLMFVKAQNFEDWLCIHFNFEDNQYQDSAFANMSKLNGKLTSYIDLAEKHFFDQESRWFKLAEEGIDNLDTTFDPYDYSIINYHSDFDKYIVQKALQKYIEFANDFTDWDNIWRHHLPFELKNSPYSLYFVKCYEAMYATAGGSINYLDILYNLLISIQGDFEEYFEKNNSQNLKINDMIQSVINQMRVFIVEVKGLLLTHSNYWVKFYEIAKRNENSNDQKLVLDGLKNLEAKYDFWAELEKYQQIRYPEIADIALKKMKEVINLVS